MNRPDFSFTKLIVEDLEAMARFYQAVYGLNAVGRVQERIGGEAIDEIMLTAGSEVSPGSLVLLKYLDRPATPRGEVILGFTTSDLPELVERIRAAGGTIHEEMRELPKLGLRVAFAKDPEGHLAELVQMAEPSGSR
jgi:predicted enzyme related to lactoylglutathione lyase